jgi:hypothetical protein
LRKQAVAVTRGDEGHLSAFVIARGAEEIVAGTEVARRQDRAAGEDMFEI